MKFAVPENEVRAQLDRQLASLFSLNDKEAAFVDAAWNATFERLERRFSCIKNKYYSCDGETYFDSLHGCQWTHFLYTLSNEIYRQGGVRSVCDKIYALNRALSSADLFYEVELPDVFTFDHPLGAVMGRAEYSNYFTFSQGCTVGNNHGVYPRFGERVFMLSNSKVIGDCAIGDNVVIAANTYVKDQDVPSDSLVFGASPNLIIKENHKASVDAHAEGVFVYE